MKRRKLKQYLDKRWKRIRISLRSLAEADDPEDLHRFRVQVKRLQAFIALAKEGGHRSALEKSFKPLKKLFKKAGKIRDMQFYLELSKAHGGKKAFLESRRKEVKAGMASLRAWEQSYTDRIRKSRKLMKRKVQPVPNQKIERFYGEQLTFITALITHAPSPEELHTCRKRIKILLYNFKWAHQALKISLDKDYLKTLEQAIGDWHDNWLLAGLFPELKAKNKRLRRTISLLAQDFYSRATAAAASPGA